MPVLPDPTHRHAKQQRAKRQARSPGSPVRPKVGEVGKQRGGGQPSPLLSAGKPLYGAAGGTVTSAVPESSPDEWGRWHGETEAIAVKAVCTLPSPSGAK